MTASATLGSSTLRRSRSPATAPCIPAGNGATSETSLTYGNASNRITTGTWRNSNGIFQTGAPVYDAAGNMTGDHQNTYLYNAEGRVCAVQGGGAIIGYLYDTEGHRVAKGSLTSLSCDPSANGFSATNTYVIGPDGGEMTEVDQGAFVHTNVSAGGEMIATFKSDGPPPICFRTGWEPAVFRPTRTAMSNSPSSPSPSAIR